MKRYFHVLVGVVCLALGVPEALGQGDSTSFVMGEYYVCDQNRQEFADMLTEHVFAPVLEKHVKEGHLTGWGWLAHNTGGRWRRVLYYAANDLDTLLQTREKMEEEYRSSLAAADREFTSICPEHDDLIWRAVAGSPISEQLQRPNKATYSTYYICDVSRQERADEIVKELMAPEVNKLVASGEIENWGWYAHVIGGRYRRLMTHRGKDHAALLAAVVKYGEAAAKANPALSQEFDQICNSHVDYLWDVILPKTEGDN